MVEQIKKACADRLITVAELEKRAKLPENAIYKWDRHKPSVDRVARVAVVLGVTVDSLIREDTPQRRTP